MDNRIKIPAYRKDVKIGYNIDGRISEISLQEGYVMRHGDQFLFRPDRGSGGFALYSTEKRAEMQRMDPGEKPIKGKLVFIPDNL